VSPVDRRALCKVLIGGPLVDVGGIVEILVDQELADLVKLIHTKKPGAWPIAGYVAVRYVDGVVLDEEHRKRVEGVLGFWAFAHDVHRLEALTPRAAYILQGLGGDAPAELELGEVSS
jgi:hypothetical protein